MSSELVVVTQRTWTFKPPLTTHYYHSPGAKPVESGNLAKGRKKNRPAADKRGKDGRFRWLRQRWDLVKKRRNILNRETFSACILKTGAVEKIRS
ncbi:MAG: hypothetical protein E6K70_06550 [Planctomycetota bacterium]|nr:MAG: hypothetical protein E6K70_06550 [Planctomycetota bacterium]